MSTAIAEKAERFTVLVGCWGKEFTMVSTSLLTAD